jgi:NAD(P)-dependent dehydrogenase (short-subunit alcohol dehydrogenase family)
MTEERVAVVTGASAGFGLLTARRLRREGYRVFGTSRVERSGAAQGVEMLVLDVRSDDSVRECVGRVVESAGRIDLLVNNAGVLAVGPAEETAPEDIGALFETNFFGVVRMTNAVLPSMRRRRRGRIVNVGSLSGLVAVPGEAFYSASKFALEGYSEALRYEVEPFGIKVSLVEPGFFKTNIHHSLARQAGAFDDYSLLRSAMQSSIEESIGEGDDPEKVARTIARIAREKSPRLRYRVGSDARWVPRIKKVLPERIFEEGVRRRFGLTKAAGYGADLEARARGLLVKSREETVGA